MGDGGWQDREAHFKSTPNEQFIEYDLKCGCRCVWPTAAMGFNYQCDYHSRLADREMERLQNRRYAMARS